MTVTDVLLLGSTGLYGGFQWTIRMLVYPQFAAVEGADFPAYERQHTRRVSIVVGPLFMLYASSAILALVVRPGVLAAVVAGCFVVIVIATGLGAVPKHRQLSAGFEQEIHRKLLTVDSVRLAASALGFAAAVTFALTT